MIRPLLSTLLLLSGCSGDPAPPADPRPAPVRAPEPGVLRLAGSGAMVPLARALAAAYPPGDLRIIVEESIGSGGGVRAAADGAVDLGMISRPLRDDERSPDLELVPAGRDAVVIAAHPSVPVAALTSDELVALYRGERRTFPDGTPATVLLRDRSESANATLERIVPALAAAREEAYRRGRYRVLYHDQAMVEALAATPGAIGVSNLGALSSRSGLKVLALDGRTPSIEAAADGRWPAVRPLFFLGRRDRIARARPFLAFVASEVGLKITSQNGYLPK